MNEVESIANLIGQRLAYILKGNYHGVSANWLNKNCDLIYASTYDFLSSGMVFPNFELSDLEEGEFVFEQTISQKSGVNFGASYDCEIGLASFLYAYILQTKPIVVVETGVANGITTNVILSALKKVGGVLHSFDIDPRTEGVHPASPSWNFHLLEGNVSRTLKDEVAKIGKIDLWIHDSNHGYRWQNFEYRLALQALSIGGLLVSDDIDSSTAWGLLESRQKMMKCGIFDNRKMYGVAQLSQK